MSVFGSIISFPKVVFSETRRSFNEGPNIGFGPWKTEFDHVEINMIAFLAEGTSWNKTEKRSACVKLFCNLAETQGQKGDPWKRKISKSS